MSEVHDDPLMREGRDNLVGLLACLHFNDSVVLCRQNIRKATFKCQILDYFKRLQPSEVAVEQFWESTRVNEILKTPAEWSEVRNIVETHLKFAFRFQMCLLFWQIVMGFLGYWAGVNYIWLYTFCVAIPSQLMIVIGFHLNLDWKYIRRWDRMWESSAFARELCPEHPAFNPSRRAKKFLAFTLSPTAYFDVVEDLNDGFEKHSAELGFRYARAWYVWNAFKSLSPVIDGAIERLVKWSALAGATECVRQLLAHK